jgi:hypothetical protein
MESTCVRLCAWTLFENLRHLCGSMQGMEVGFPGFGGGGGSMMMNMSSMGKDI